MPIFSQKKILNTQLRRNMFSGTVLSAANTVVSLVAYPVYLYFLGFEMYGLWLLLAVVLDFSRLGMLGIPTVMTKLVAEEEGKKDFDGLSKYISTALTLICGSGLVVVLFIMLFRETITELLGLNPDQSALASHYLPFISLLSFYVFITETINSVLSGLGRMDQANYIQSTGRIVMPIVSSILLFFGWGLESLLIGNTIGYFIVHVASLARIRKIYPIIMLPFLCWDKATACRIIQFSGGMSSIEILNIFLVPFNKVFIVRYVNLEAVPVYEIGYRVASQLRSFFHIFFKALLPEVSKELTKESSNGLQKIRNLNNKSLKLIFLVGFPAYIILFFVATPLLKIWLGNGFIDTMPPVLKVLLVSSFLILVGTPSYFTLLGMGKVRVGVFSMIIQAASNITGIIGLLISGVQITVFLVALITVISTSIGQIYIYYQNWKLTFCIHTTQQ